MLRVSEDEGRVMKGKKVQQAANELPNAVDVDKLAEKFGLLEKIEQGEQQLARGEGVPHEEVKKRLKTWLQ
jgi:hypothetical protein